MSPARTQPRVPAGRPDGGRFDHAASAAPAGSLPGRTPAWPDYRVDWPGTVADPVGGGLWADGGTERAVVAAAVDAVHSDAEPDARNRVVDLIASDDDLFHPDSEGVGFRFDPDEVVTAVRATRPMSAVQMRGLRNYHHAVERISQMRLAVEEAAPAVVTSLVRERYADAATIELEYGDGGQYFEGATIRDHQGRVLGDYSEIDDDYTWAAMSDVPRGSPAIIRYPGQPGAGLLDLNAASDAATSHGEPDRIGA